MVKTAGWGLALFVMTLAVPARAADRAVFYPGTLDTVTGLPASLDEFTPAERCGYCHPDQHGHWVGSMHGNAFRDPLFQAVWKEASREEPATARACAGCHTPIGSATEQVWIREDGEIVIHPFAEEGVSCDFCHSVERLVVLEKGGDPREAGWMLDPGGPKRGPYADAFSTFHETAFSFVHTQSEFCGVCHNVFHPVSGAAIARTYAEWKGSVYAREEIHCQDCHMVPPDVAATVAETLTKPVVTGVTSSFGTERTPYFEHNFTGANVAVPALLRHAQVASDAEARLKTAATVELSVPASGQPGREMTVEVRVRNRAAGHNLPTSMSELRQMWLQVALTDRSGWRWVSGALDERGRLDPGAKVFGARAVDAQGQPTWKPWRIARIERDNSIPPRGQALLTYRIPVPEGADGPLAVTATLRYRSFPQSVAEEYLTVENYRVPVIDMAAASAAVPLSAP